MVKTHVEESLGANPGDAALNPADPVAMGLSADRVVGFLDSDRGRAFRALRHRAYRLLFVSFLVNQLGFWLCHISLQALMVSLTDNDPLQIGFLFFALFVPAFGMAPVAGVAADRYSRKAILLVCYAGVAVVVGVLAALTAAGWMTTSIVLAVALALGICFAFSGPAGMAVAANAVPGEDLPSAISLQSAINNLTRVLGPALAAPIVASGRYAWSFAIYFVFTLVAAGLTAAMRVAPVDLGSEDGGLFARLRNGFEHARERRPAVAVLVTVAVTSFLGVAHVALLPVFAEEALGRRELFAWMVAASGVGAFAGALATGHARSVPDLRAAAIRLMGFAAGLLVFASARTPALALPAQVVIGFFYFSVMTSLQTLLQQLVDEARRGRVMSLFQVAWAGIVPFGGLALGAVGRPAGAAATIAGAASLLFVYAAFVTWRAPVWSAPLPRA